MEYLAENWLTLTSLLIALFGGVPGVISAVSYFKDKPKLHFSLSNLIAGERPGPQGNESMLFVSGTVANSGSKPLSPGRFELEILSSGEWIPLEKSLIPEGANFQSEKQQIDIAEPWKMDLQKFSGSIHHGQPIIGFLMFGAKSIELGQLHALLLAGVKLRVSCIDIYEKRYQCIVTSDSSPIEGRVDYPKHGVSIEEKT